MMLLKRDLMKYCCIFVGGLRQGRGEKQNGEYAEVGETLQFAEDNYLHNLHI